MSGSWDNVILDPIYSYGFSGGPGFGTRVVQMDGGGEQRLQIQSEPIWTWSASRDNFESFGVDASGLRDFFLARRGALYGFLFIDPTDYTTAPDHVSAPTGADVVIGFGDGDKTLFTCRKRYTDPGGMESRSFYRKIVPLTGTASAAQGALFDAVEEGGDINPIVQVGGVTQTLGTDYTISTVTGQIRFASAPAIGAIVTMGGYFAVPARFSENTDSSLEISSPAFNSDTASYEIVSLPNDDPAPMVAGGAFYGYTVISDNSTTVVNLDSKEAHFYEIANAPGGTVSIYVSAQDHMPLGGPHFTVRNNTSDASELQFYDDEGAAIGGAVSINNKVDVYMTQNSSGDRALGIVATPST